MNPAPTIDALSVIEQVLPTGCVADQLRAVQALQDALDAKKAALLAELHATKAYEDDGASTLNSWVRNELRMTASDAAALVRGSATFEALPLVAQAAREGTIRADHVRVFTYGLKHLGAEIMAKFEEAFVVLAQNMDPAELFARMRKLRDQMFPDDLDGAYVKGMDKEDINITKLLDGWHVTGFLNALTGLKFKKVLDSVSAPRDKDDDRPGSERRVQGFDDLLSDILGSGMPTDKGVKPHMSVIVDADTLQAAAERVKATTERPYRTPDPMPDTTPATLVGFGSIGANLLMYFACVSEFTAFLMKEGSGFRQAQILNAERGRKDPTMKQRQAVLVRQNGVCAAPGCSATHLEIHHTVFWSRGGKTNLDLLIGLCTRCHHSLHAGKLHITGNAVDGFEFTKRNGAPLRKRRRTSYPHAA